MITFLGLSLREKKQKLDIRAAREIPLRNEVLS